MMDLAAALGGAGGGPPVGAGGPPVGPGAPPPDTVGPAGPAPGEQDQGPQFSSSLDALDAAEEALHAFIQLDQDEPDRAAAAQLLQGVLKLKAANQTSQQSGDLKSLQRALQPGPGVMG
jgi:hypothetical protein